ncbi:receptor-type tyrosine-protein phosphatase beta isoform X1 [Silurus meridionalis]|nr:receptor-type tyrosine-protein phosphatase beta isoform X1 [Silurus meridionalis]XP_046716061.1 receptor-type tyrosine-protein phosphatase beta isoform X1 [Silurus meridionalis]XP_046716062.1 receptor-type tyrosine-protein phosphatase beta isoform X1 [Silurus meridionalis]
MFTVTAVAADNQTTGAPTQISAFTNPDIVTNLSVSNKTTSSVSLTWNEPNGYRSYFTVQWNNGSVNNIINSSITSCTVTGLTVGVNYTFTVTAVAADTQTTGSPTQISAFTKPDVISDLSVTEITIRSLFLNWTEPIGKSSFFKVQWSNNITLNSATSNTFYNITNLNPGVNYTILISAVAADNITEGGAIVYSVFTKPDTVSILTAVNVTTSSILLYWIKAMGEISYYVVQYDHFSRNISTTTEFTMINITNLTPGVQYTFKVFAVVADNKTKGNSNYISAYTKPDVVKDLNVTEITTSSLFLNWTEPIGKRSFFKVQWSNNITLNSTTSNTFYNILNLNPGVNYTILISAVAADNITEGGAIGLSVFTKPDTVSNLTAVNVTTSSILLYWIKAMGEISYYVVQYNNFSTNISMTTELTRINITNLTPGVQYTFKVLAVVADNKTKGNSSYISAYTKPDVVKDLNVTEITTNSLFLNWTEPIGIRSFFKVQWSNNITLNSTTSNTFYNITNLSPGVNYTILISAVAADNITEGGAISHSVFTKPDTVSNLTAVNVTTSSILLYWIKAMGEISYYVVQYDDFSRNISTTTEFTMININNLTPGVQYTFKVFAVVADNKTEGNSNYISAYTKPDVVKDLNVIEITTRSLFLNWTEPLGIRYFFKVQWSNNITLNSTTSNTFYNITNLSPGVNYTILISAVAADNITEGGAIGHSVFTKPDTVSNLTAVNVTTSSILLYWIKAMGEISYYVVQYDNFSTNISTTTELTMINITNLTPGVQYTFKVFAVVADNKTKGNCSYISAYTKPDVMKDLNVIEITTRSLFLNWTEPIGKRSFFKVQWSNNITLNSTTSNTFYNITNLSPGVNYTILISAVAADNITEGGTIGLSVFTKPDTVSNLTAVNITTSSILLYWIKAMGEISYYVVQYDNFSTNISTTTELTMINITNLIPGVQYTFKVFAVVADNKTKGNSSYISAYTKPDVVKDLNVTEITTRSLFLNWTEPIGKRSFFKVQWSNNITLNSTTSNTFYNITNLSPGVNYTILISAVAADNITEGGAIGRSVYTKPDFVRHLNVTEITTSSLFLNWTEPIGKRSFFKVQWSNNITLNSTTSNTFYNITNLSPGVNYTILISAVAADNITEGGAIGRSVFTKPDTVSNLAAVNVTTSSILLYWIKAMGEISYYVVQYDNFSTNISTTTELTRTNITNLTPGVQYTFKVFAVVADNKTEGNSNYISAYTKPDFVRHLNVIEITTSSLFLNWTEPIGKRSFFKVQWSNNITLNSTTSNFFYNITNLSPGVNYTILISAVAADNITEGGTIGLSVFTKPDTVSNFAAVNVTTSSILLYWIKAMGEIFYYVVQYNNFSTNISTTTELTMINITNLIPGVQYTFKVFAVVADNKTKGNCSYISAYTKPDVVRDLNVIEITTRSLFLNWTEPIGKKSFFKVQWSNNITLNSTTSNTFYNITNLSPGVNYTILISAVAADNITEGGAIGRSVFTKPDTVSNLAAVNVTTSSILLYWIKAMGEISYYVVQYDNFSTNISTTTELTMINITNLTPGVQYTFKVFAVVTDNKTEGNSSYISAYTKPDVVKDLNVIEITTSSLFLNWTEPIGKRSFFKVQWSNNITLNSTTSNTFYNITNLSPGVNYTILISAVAADNITEGGTIVHSVFTKPDTVSNLAAVNVTTSSILLYWIKAMGKISYYVVQYDNFSTNISTTTELTMINITNLIPGVQYTFKVFAVVADNKTEGNSSYISAYTKPDVVKDLNVIEITTRSLFLNWTEPIGKRSFFKVQWSNNITLNSTTSNTFYNITNLSPGVNYTILISAVAADNITEGGAIGRSVYTKPDFVRHLNVTEITTSSLFLNWTEPIGKSSFFKVQWSNNITLNSTTSNTFYNITNLSPGVNYTILISAVAADNITEGGAIGHSVFTKPDVVRDLNVTEITTRSLFLNWTEPIGKRSFFRVQWSNDSSYLNSTTSNTFYNILNLSPGVNYTILISAVAADNITEGGAIGRSVYTKPDTVSILTAVNVTTSSVFLYWIKAMGKISYYVVQYDNFIISTEFTMINITNLTPGVQYTFKVFAVVADNKTKGNSSYISAYTKPDVVRDLNVTEITTRSLFLNWTEPIGKSSFFKVQWSNNITLNSTTLNTFYNITNLIPGVNYTILISAVAADNITEGGAIGRSVYTKPDIVRNLKTSEVTTTSVFLSWTEPLGKISFFRVQWINSSTTTSATSFNITGLTPGTNYTFTVSAVADDNKTEGSVVGLSICTGTSPVFNISCVGPNRTAAALNLTWTNPPGNNQGFNINLNSAFSNFTPFCNPVCNYFISNNLQYFNTYNLTISTLGCGEIGSLDFQCRTGVTDPPVPSKPEDVKIEVTPVSQTAVTLQFSSNLLNTTNGPIEAYGVLLSTNPQSNNSKDFLTRTYNNWSQDDTKPYITVLKLNEETTRSSFITVKIGDKNDSDFNTIYKNYPLHNQEYWVALVLFTYLKIKDNLVDPQQSICSVTPFSSTTARPLPPKTIIFLWVLLPVILIVIIIIAVLIIQKKRKTKEYTDIPVNNLRSKISIPVRVEEFEAYFKKQQLDSNCGFAEQYEDLKVVGTAQTKNSALAMENKGKNRYNNVLPYDSSRVKLSIHGSPTDDYINANYISGYNSKKEYIAAQGPLPATVNEFWRMIWEKNAHTIVMLTKCYEQGRVKCEKYWPAENKPYNNILVTTTSEIELEDWTIRDFRIKNVKTAETRDVRQFHFTAWPDHGVPETTEVLINFRHLVREHMDNFSRNAPAVVHCSAGVGRTGTLIALDHLIFQIERESMVDIYGIIYNMRMHRPLMVQTEDQYVFLSQCASDIIKSRMGTNVDLIYQNAAAFSIYENVQR